MNPRLAVVIPNWNGADFITKAIDSIKKQSLPATLIVVDNGSTDGSLALLQPLSDRQEITLITRDRNYGFTGGVNPGMQYAIDNHYQAVAPFNSDALADPDWLRHLFDRLQKDPKTGIVACKLLTADGAFIDSTGDQLSIWGLPYPRGRGEPASNTYDRQNRILGASGGASLYRCAMLQQIGLFDDDFFAYYEDVDLSLRARLAGWEVYYEPQAVTYHMINQTSRRLKGFTTYQTIKNLPWMIIKNIPGRLFWRMYPRFLIAYWAFVASATVQGKGLYALKGLFVSLLLTPKKIAQRLALQKHRIISAEDINNLLLHDLPPNATKLRALRKMWWHIRGRRADVVE